MTPTVLDDDETIPTADDALMATVRAEVHAPLTRVGEFGAATTQGHVRSSNQDAWGHLGHELFVLADGMGGYAGGGLAARTAVSALLSTAASKGVTDWPNTIKQLNHQVRTATRGRGFDRAGAALVIVAMVGGVASVINVGDARACRLRAGRLLQLTTDHTVEAELARSGIDLRTDHPRSVPLTALTRHLGSDNVEPDASTLVPFDGDMIVLMSDGVYRQVTQHEIKETIRNATCEEAATTLVSLANEAGGRDNATAVVIRLTSEEM